MAPRVFSDAEIIEAYRKSFPAIGPGNYFEIFDEIFFQIWSEILHALFPYAGARHEDCSKTMTLRHYAQ